MSAADQLGKCDDEVQILNQKVDKLTNHVRRSDSTLGYSIAKIEMSENFK
jgi:hypothetical protein